MRFIVCDRDESHLLVGFDDCCEGLVELPHLDVLLLDACSGERKRHDLGRCDGEVDRVESGIRVATDTCKDLLALAVLLGDLLVTKHQRAGTIVERAAVRRRHSARPRTIKRRLERGDLLQLETVVALVLRNDSIALLALDSDSDDLVVEQLLLPRRLRPLVRLDRERVLLLASHLVLLRRRLRAVAHVDLVVHVPQAVLDQAVVQLHLAERRLLRRASEVVRHAAHVLHAARDQSLFLAKLDLLRGDADGFHAAGADLVDGRRFDTGRQAGEHACLTRRGLSHAALEHVAHVDMAELLHWHRGASDGFLDSRSA